ncbi:flagellar protein FlaG [Paenibacillus sp. Marseille-Q9583]
MNVQFSLSATALSGGNSRGETVSKNSVFSSVEQFPSIRDTKDLNTKERQGVNVSLAEGQLIRNIERAVKALQGPQTTLEISVHEKTHDIMVKVMNKDTGELIREIPPEKTLDLVAKMMEIAGILVDEKI